MLFHARLGVNQFHSWEQLLKITDFFPPSLSFHSQYLNQFIADSSTNTQQSYSKTHQLSSAYHHVTFMIDVSKNAVHLKKKKKKSSSFLLNKYLT